MMATKISGYLSFFTFLLLAPLCLRSRELPSFSPDKAIVHSFLPNGAEYYLIQNKESIGYADFALVQKNYVNEAKSRKLLAYLPDFGTVSPASFLASKGIGYSPDGLVFRIEGSTVYRFDNIPVYDSSAQDSTLLIIFNIMRCTDASQAVIVSGDIDTRRISDRMYALSMTVSRLKPSPVRNPYEWQPRKKMETRTERGRYRNQATVTLSFHASRTPDKYMNTPQPLVTRMLAGELGAVMSNRIKTLFQENNIPLAECEFFHRDSRMTAGDEIYTVQVGTDEASALKAVGLLGRIIGELGARGAAADEFRDAREALRWKSSNSTALPKNSQYVVRCLRSYLFGASLVNEAEEREFFTSHRLPLDQERGLLNDFTSQLFHSPSAAELVCSTWNGSVTSDNIGKVFREGWSKGASEATALFYPSFGADTLSSVSPKRKVKIKSEAADPVTGGELWTFSNGMKVVFKQVDGIDGFEYALMIRGGFSGVHGLVSGESAFVGDMLSLCSVGGLPSGAFYSMLATNGIKLKTEVSASDMRICGSAPASRLELLLKSLMVLSGDRTIETRTFERYRREEALRLGRSKMTADELSAISDSLMSPGYKYSTIKRISNLSETLPSKAETYFSSQFGRFADGILVFVGNINRSSLQKLLCRYLGEFKTSRTSSIRPRIPYRMAKGWQTYSFDSSFSGMGPGGECVSLEMAITPPFNMNTYMAFKMVAATVEKAVARELAPLGVCAEVTPGLDIFPSDRLSLSIVARACKESGLPYGISPASPNVVLNALRSAIVKASKTGISESELLARKDELKARLSSEMKSPSGLCLASVTRYSLGRDLVSHYAEYVDAVSTQAVDDILKSLASGVKVEVIAR